MDPRVTTSAGALRGVRVGRVAAFRGIPYAAPPVGPARLRPPQPPAPWRGERDATRPGAAPPQRADPLARALGLQVEAKTDEDCLFLDVWTPGPDAGRRPVLVWIPGGAFATGSGSAPVQDGARLAERGDAVVVTLSYRVGALGFLCLGPGAEGANFGLQDQLAALHWVAREIGSFGGDPARVTVFGESAGAGSIAALLAMPASRGLFRRAIVQSGAVDGVLSAPEAGRRADLLLGKLGRGPGDRLAGVPVEALLEAQARCLAEGPWRTGMFFAPVVDGALLPERPLEAVRAGRARDVELVIGTTADEMRLFAGGPGEPRDDGALARQVAAQLPGPRERSAAQAARAIETTRRARTGRGESVAPADLLCAIQTDLYLRAPAIRLAEAQCHHQPRTFMYVFCWRSPLRGGALGACHALDVPFTFGNLDAPGVAAFAGSGEDAQRVAGSLMDAWLAFARAGDPACAATGPWPPYEATQRWTLELGARCRAVRAPGEAERALWEELAGEAP